MCSTNDSCLSNCSAHILTHKHAGNVSQADGGRKAEDRCRRRGAHRTRSHRQPSLHGGDGRDKGKGGGTVTATLAAAAEVEAGKVLLPVRHRLCGVNVRDVQQLAGADVPDGTNHKAAARQEVHGAVWAAGVVEHACSGWPGRGGQGGKGGNAG